MIVSVPVVDEALRQVATGADQTVRLISAPTVKAAARAKRQYLSFVRLRPYIKGEATTDPQTRLIIDDPPVDEKIQPRWGRKKAPESNDTTLDFEARLRTAADQLRWKYGMPSAGNAHRYTVNAFGRRAA